MKLHIKDRIYFPQILPKENSFMDFNLKKALLQKVGLTDKDRDEFGIKEDRENGRITWDAEKDQKNPLDIKFTEQEIAYLKKGCEALSSSPYPDDFWVFVEKIYNEAIEEKK